MRIPFVRKKVVLGIDPQPGELRLAVMTQQGNCFYLTHAVRYALPGFLIDGSTRQWDALTTALMAAMHEWQIVAQFAVMGLPGQLTRSQQVRLPRQLGERDILQQVQSHLARDLPGENNLCVDFVSLPAPEPALQRIHFMAAKETHVLQCQQAVNAAGLMLHVIDVDVYALVRCIMHCLSPTWQGMQASAKAILYAANLRKVYLALFDEDRLLFHHEWHDVQSIAALLAEVNLKMQPYAASMTTAISHCIVCGDDRVVNAISAMTLSWAAHVVTFDFPAFLGGANSNIKIIQNKETIIKESASHLISCGLAMRGDA